MRIMRWIVLPLVLGALPASAVAQGLGTDRFFSPDSPDESGGTQVDGSLTSTTFYYAENGEDAPTPATANEIAPFSASPVDRIFTDLRTQLSASHIGGSKAELRLDARGRFDASSYATFSRIQPGQEEQVPAQSGAFGGNEIDLRELYVRRDGTSVDLSFGRQYSLELAATKFDGLKVEAGSTNRWKYIGFGGLYPSRISRDLRDDYARKDGDLAMPGFQEGGGVALPVTGGAGAAYRSPGAYGAFGVVGILPLAEDAVTGESEEARVFATANGYWRASQKVDFYHYLVADAVGAGGAGLTNLTLGVNLQPSTSLRAYANITRVDTETLNVTAQERLLDPDSDPGDGVKTTAQNNLEVARIAQDAARVGLSAAMGPNVELSVNGGVRRRGEIRFEALNGDPDDAGDDIVFAASQAADVNVMFVDRDSIADMRLGLSATASFGVGESLYRTTSYVGRVDASKELADGRADVELNLTYLNATDDNHGTQCTTTNLITCYGATSVQSVTVGGLAFWRFSASWFALLSATVGPQFSESASAGGDPVTQPTILTAAGLLRLAYRF